MCAVMPMLRMLASGLASDTLDLHTTAGAARPLPRAPGHSSRAWPAGLGGSDNQLSVYVRQGITDCKRRLRLQLCRTQGAEPRGPRPAQDEAQAEQADEHQAG